MEDIFENMVTNKEQDREGNELENKIKNPPLETVGSQGNNVQPLKNKIGDILNNVITEQLSDDKVETKKGNEIDTETEIDIEEHDNSEIVGSKESNIVVNNRFEFSKKSLRLGISQKVLKVCLDKSHATTLTIILLTLFSCWDSGTDLGMWIGFLLANFKTEGVLYLLTDLLPVFLTLNHFFMSSMRGMTTFREQAMLAAVFIILCPFMPTICNFLWLACRLSGRTN